MRLMVEVDPVFAPFAKAASASELLPSCPGSARARLVWQALPACGCSCRGRAARPWRSQAEPGNEKIPGIRAARVVTRKTAPISSIFLSPLNRTTRDSYTYALSLKAVACAMRTKNSDVQGRRARSARYVGCANVLWSDLD